MDAGVKAVKSESCSSRCAVRYRSIRDLIKNTQRFARHRGQLAAALACAPKEASIGMQQKNGRGSHSPAQDLRFGPKVRSGN